MGSFSLTFVRRFKTAVPGIPMFRRPHGNKWPRRLLWGVWAQDCVLCALHDFWLVHYITVICLHSVLIFYALPLNETLKTTNGKSWNSFGHCPFWINICFFSFLFLSAVFHLDSVGSNMTTLWAAEAGLYVGIDNRGNIITSVSTSLFCHFHWLNKVSILIN